MVTLDLSTGPGERRARFAPPGEDGKPRTDLDDLKKRHQAALDAFKASAAAFAKQRQREMEDLKFVDFDEQWDPTSKTNRAGNQAVGGLPPTPPRPTIVINQLRSPCQQVANTRRNARLALTFAPKGGGATQDVAEVFEDIVRAAQAESRASIARNWAGDRAEKCGMGWYRVDTEYADEDPTDPASWNDQNLAWRRILNQASVYPDASAQEPDFSDGRLLFVTEDMPWAEYKRRFKDSDLAHLDDDEITGVGELMGIGDGQPNWVMTTDDGDAGKVVRIAECWEIVERERTKVMLSDGRAAFDDDIPEGVTVATGTAARKRRVKDRVLMWSLMNCMEYLEAPREANGRYIPIIPTIGEEGNVNGERRWWGIVRPGRDAAVSYNVLRAAQIETIASASKTPWIGYMETIEPYLEWWKNSAIRNYFFLPVKAAYDKAGNLLPFPQRNVQEPAIQAITMAAQAAKDDVHTTTGIPPVSLGQVDPHERSGKAIQALQGQAEVGSSGYLDNFVSITLAYEGKVVRDLIPRLFDRPGRIVPAVGLDEKRRLVMLNYPYVDGPNGQPVKALPNWEKGQPVPEQIPGPDGQPLEVKYVDLASGEFSVQPVAGKSFATRQEAVNNAIQSIMQVVTPEMSMALAPAFIESLDTPDALRLAEIAKKALPPQLAAAYEDGQPGIDPEKQQLQMQVQQLQQALESKQMEEQAKQQAQTQRELTKAQIDSEVTIQKAQIDAQVRIEVAKINAQAGLTEASIKAGLEQTGHQIQREEAMIGRDHELAVQQRDHEHERDMAQVSAELSAAQADQDQANALEQGAMSHQQTLEAQAMEPQEPA